MNPIEPPQGICWEPSWMIRDCPIFVDNGKEPIHQVRNVLKVWGNVIPNINGFFAVASSKLRNIETAA
jgi:hypothetical protein